MANETGGEWDSNNSGGPAANDEGPVAGPKASEDPGDGNIFDSRGSKKGKDPKQPPNSLLTRMQPKAVLVNKGSAPAQKLGPPPLLLHSHRSCRTPTAAAGPPPLPLNPHHHRWTPTATVGPPQLLLDPHCRH